LWDIATGDQIQVLEGHKGNIHDLSFSPEEPFTNLASSSIDGTVRVWNIKSGAQIWVQSFSGRRYDKLVLCAYSPDGTSIAIFCGGDSTTRLLNAKTGQQIWVKQHNSDTGSINFSPDGSSVVTGLSNLISILDTKTGEILQSYKLRHDGLLSPRAFIYDVTCSADGQYLAAAFGNSETVVRLWKLNEERTQDFHTMDNEPVSKIQFSPKNPNIFASASAVVRLWNSKTGAEVQRFERSGFWYVGIAFSPDGQLLAASESSAVRVWKVSTDGFNRAENHGHRTFVGLLRISPDKKRLATTSWDRTVKLWDIPSGREIASFRVPFLLDDISFSPCSQDLALVNDSGDIRILHPGLSEGQYLTKFMDDKKHPYFRWKEYAPVRVTIAFSPDGKMVAVGASRATYHPWVGIWNKTGELIRSFENDNTEDDNTEDDNTEDYTTEDDNTEDIDGLEHPRRDGVTPSLAWSPDQQFLAITSSEDLTNNQTLRIWNVETGEVVHRFSVDNSVSTIAFSSDGHKLRTNYGTLSLSPPFPSVLDCNDTLRKSTSHPKIGYEFSNEWIKRDNKNFLWLPDTHRPKNWIFVDDVMIMGHDSGMVSFFEFKF
jgi:WD40 repeat protein